MKAIVDITPAILEEAIKLYMDKAGHTVDGKPSIKVEEAVKGYGMAEHIEHTVKITIPVKIGE